MQLNVKAFALTSALVWGVGVFVLTWWIWLVDSPGGDVGLLGRMYPGYEITAMGSVVGLAWALVDGLICGAIFAWIYNCCAKGK